MLQGSQPVSNRDELPGGWVACSERMPERDVDVLVYCADKKEQMVGYMERNEAEGWFRFASLPNGGGVYCKPTHWMPLPAAPQQDDARVRGRIKAISANRCGKCGDSLPVKSCPCDGDSACWVTQGWHETKLAV
ncbi:DUF551 domain-containing protein [Salmonella enterica subsp. enterica serovar Ohio]|nr:DUF551 domain-containing protein [Salmonella enterica subsp. enterica serovar Ohio]